MQTQISCWCGRSGVATLFMATISILCMSMAFVQELKAADYVITQEIIAEGGGSSVSNDYIMFETIGQSGPVGASQSTSYQTFSGLWSEFINIIEPVPTLRLLTVLVLLIGITLVIRRYYIAAAMYKGEQK